MKRILLSAAILLATGAFLVIAGGASNSTSGASYKIEFDNAFGLVTGSDFKVAGVRAGKIKSIDLCYTDHGAGCQSPMHALVTVSVTQGGFGSFRSDAFCQSRPQSLIGEYFIECQPGTSGKVLKPGSTIPVTRTFSTIAGDLLQNVMRMPYRERFTLIINELGAAVAGRSGDLQAALRRAVPALTETENLLNLLANDSHNLQQLNLNADNVITALANNGAQVQRFIVEANKAATATATQQSNLQSTFQQLPAFLEQLRPAMAKLGAASDAQTPVLSNLNQAAGNLRTFFRDLVPFSNSSRPALKSLGDASKVGTPAAIAATPTIRDLNRFARPTPELAQNLAIVLHDLDNRGRAVEADSRSPGGKGYTGLEALLQYVFNQALAVNAFGPFGHMLTVDAFVDPQCSPYATAASISSNLKMNGASYRHCYSWLGPNQPGINTTDPSNPGGCVPDPGGAPPGRQGPKTTACKLPSTDVSKSADTQSGQHVSAANTGAAGQAASTSLSPTGAGGGSSGPAGSVQSTIGQLLGLFGGGTGAARSSGVPSTSEASSGSSSGSQSGSQAMQLLNYLMAP